MPPTTLRSPPSVGDYTPLEDFQTQTPETFVGGKPVLHHHISGAKASIPKSQAGSLAVFPADAAASREASDANGEVEEVIEREVDVFVNSESVITAEPTAVVRVANQGARNFTIFSNEAEAGVSIPYPSISIHAVKQIGPQDKRVQAVWMQLEFSDGGNDDEDFNCVELTINPPASDSDTSPTPAAKLYEAIANCSNLHPDPYNEDEEEDDNEDRIVFEGSAEHEALDGFSGVLRGAADGSLPPPMPGSGGWITADNMHEYFDEEGNWIGGGNGGSEELGDGAGRIRGHDEVDGHEANGDGPEDTKRSRVD